jgi:hypothetical protein
VVVGLLKSAPVLLSVIFLVRYSEEFFTGYQAEPWRRLTTA